MVDNTEIIAQLNSTVLTQEYISQRVKSWGRDYICTIFLKDISAIEYSRYSNPFLLIIATFLLIIGFFIGRDTGASLIFGAFFCVLGYFITRKSAVWVTSHSRNSIVQPVAKDCMLAKEFMQEVLKAKAEQ